MKKILYVGLVLFLAFGALKWDEKRKSTLSYWQTRAAKVRIGMTRAEAEKILPRQNFKSPIWRLEMLRFQHAPSMPALKKPDLVRVVHSNDSTVIEYEVGSGVYVTMKYDSSGSAPGQTNAGTGYQPGDRVISLPTVEGSRRQGSLANQGGQ